MNLVCRILGLTVLLFVHGIANAQTYPAYLDIGSPEVLDLYVDPVNGSDARSGSSEGTAFKSLTAAWNSIPQGSTLSRGVRINILPGTVPESNIPNYLESRYGTATAPIIIRSTDGRAGTILSGDLNVFDTRYLYLINLTIRPSPAGDAFHCEQCDHLLLRGNEFDGGSRQAHETVKINQSQYVYLEANDIHGAEDNAVDFVAVQHGHLLANAIHNAQDWCAYTKGGSADLRIEANTFYDCGTGGYTAGQGTGFEFMVSPWIHYEAYDIKFVNNTVHDTEGAAIGVNGGLNILMAFNTFYRVGSRSHGIEVVFGSRSCDGDTARCQSNLTAGGWGVGAISTEAPIPNKNVTIANNILLNPTGFKSESQHFAIYGPRSPDIGTNVPAPAVTDENLVISGNVIWNGPAALPLGVEGDSDGCANENATCNQTQLNADNRINSIEPSFLDVAQGDFRLASGNAAQSIPAVSIGAFPSDGRPASPLAPTGELSNLVTYDRSGAVRLNPSIPGAFEVGSSGEVQPPAGSISPGDSSPATPILRGSFGKLTKKPVSRGRVAISLPLTISGLGPFEVNASITKRRSTTSKVIRARRKSSAKYILAGIFAHGTYSIRLTITDAAHSQKILRKSIKI